MKAETSRKKIINFLQESGVNSKDLATNQNYCDYFQPIPESLIFWRKGRRLIIILVYGKGFYLKIQETIDEIGPYWEKAIKDLKSLKIEIIRLIKQEQFDLSRNAYFYQNKYCLDFGEKNPIYLEMINEAFPEYKIFPQTMGNTYIHSLEQARREPGDLASYFFGRLYYLYGEKMIFKGGRLGFLQINFDEQKTTGIQGKAIIKCKKDEYGRRVFNIYLRYSDNKEMPSCVPIIISIGQNQKQKLPNQEIILEKYLTITRKNSFFISLNEETESLENICDSEFNQLFSLEVLSLKDFFKKH
ncbi:MAG: hypothetical protein NT165_00365 [Candidatus Falkowbacteria bacterium]|nr:hypothetical protein [Candidatus Falkowbacteria bacterium]